MSRKIIDVVTNLVRDTIEDLGFELVEIEYTRKKEEDAELTIYIDHENGIFIADCERVSKAIDPILEEADPIEDAYVLIVSSPGIDRPLKTERDFEKNLAKKVEVRLYVKLDGKKELIGTLKAYTGEDITLEYDDGSTLTLERAKIALIRPYIDF